MHFQNFLLSFRKKTCIIAMDYDSLIQQTDKCYEQRQMFGKIRH